MYSFNNALILVSLSTSDQDPPTLTEPDSVPYLSKGATVLRDREGHRMQLQGSDVTTDMAVWYLVGETTCESRGVHLVPYSTVGEP